MQNGQFGLDKLSFWLGFLAASLLWFLVYRFRRFWPEILNYVRVQVKSFKQRRLAGVESQLLQGIFRRAQAYHLALSLFPLDQIIVEPYLLAPPPQAPSDDLINIRKYYPQAISYLPDAPEFAAHAMATRLSLIEALQYSGKIAIIGGPGTGKSTALAYLTTLIARRDASSGFLKTYFPLFVHIADIHTSSGYEENPALELIKAVQFQSLISAIPQSNQFIRKCLDADNAILLLDGLDELGAAEFENACKYLSALLKQHPNLRLITTATHHQGSSLLAFDIEPLAISGWNRQEAKNFTRKWLSSWNENIARQGSDQGFQPIDDLIISSWLNDRTIFHTPCEWTFKIWSACSGNLEGISANDAINAHVKRKLSDADLDALTRIANEMIDQQSAVIAYSQIERHLSAPTGSTQGESLVTRWIEDGFLQNHVDDRLSFTSSWLCGYFSSRVDESPTEQPPDKLDWSIVEAKTQFSLSQQRQAWLSAYLEPVNQPLSPKHLTASRWLKNCPQINENKKLIMRSLVQQIQREDWPIMVRMEMLANLATSNDPSILTLFRHWLSSESAHLRHLAILALGVCQDVNSIETIAACLNDPVSEVRISACYALSILDSIEAQDILKDTLQQGDELIKHAVAETLAMQGTPGHDLLKEAATSDDLLVRRAAVYGLSLIHESWVTRLLERIAIEDSQWVVRNAAGQALESMVAPNPYSPKIYQPPAETAWLIEFAARAGRGVSKQESPVPLLKQVIHSGSLSEQINALWFIRKFPNPDLLTEAMNLLHDSNPDLRETAYYILWQMQPLN